MFSLLKLLVIMSNVSTYGTLLSANMFYNNILTYYYIIYIITTKVEIIFIIIVVDYNYLLQQCRNGGVWSFIIFVFVYYKKNVKRKFYKT